MGYQRRVHGALKSEGSDSEAILRVLVPAEVNCIGFSVKPKPPLAPFVSKVDTGSWAEKKDIQVGDALISVNGTLVDELQASDFSRLMKTRPLWIELRTRRAKDMDRAVFRVFVPEEVERLGFSVKPLPPAGPFVNRRRRLLGRDERCYSW